MKNKLFTSLVALLLSVAPAVYALPVMNVIVSDADSKLAYKGVTNSDGTFATTKLAPGNYVVRFVAKGAVTKDDHYMLILSAGKKSLISNGVDGDKFKATGVAARMEVTKASSITGQVADAQKLEKAGVKVVNGRRYRWVKGRTGDNFGGRWVEDGVTSDNLIQTGPDEFRKMQDRAGIGTMGANEHGPQHDRPGGG